MVLDNQRKGTDMKLELIGDLIETEGGGVIAKLDMDEEGKAYLMQKGFEYLILRGIEQAKKEMQTIKEGEPVQLELDWDEKRLDIIGQNGPTGEHYEEENNGVI